MQLGQLGGTGLYLVDPSNPQDATWGAMVFGNQRPESLDLGSSFYNADSFYVFFPASDRGSNWASFASGMKSQIRGVSNRRFGFFDINGDGLDFLEVTGTANQQVLNGGSDFAFRNIVLRVQQPGNEQVKVSYDDGLSEFRITNLVVGAQVTVTWHAAAPGAAEKVMMPMGDLIIPLTGPAPGTLRTDLELDLTDQAAFETGPMYFGPAKSGADVLALRYPTFLVGGGAGGKIRLTAYADVALPMDPKRTFFELADSTLSSGFTTTLGHQINLAPTGGTQGVTPRFVLADRPVTQTGEVQAYYLTPMGAFSLSQAGGAQTGALICGYSSTEVFSFTQGDVLEFTPLQNAFVESTPARPATKETPAVPATYLTDAATTSWIGISSSTAQPTYYSQPQGSPIFEDDGSTGGAPEAPNGADDTATPNTAHKLKLKAIPAWPAQGSAAAGVTASPLFPMVPYGGLASIDPITAPALEQTESKGINPARRKALSNANTAKSFAPMAVASAGASADALQYNMTPLGLVGGFDGNNLWQETTFALSGAAQNRSLQFQNMGDEIRAAFYQNQVFLVMDRDDTDTGPLFTFDKADATVELADWFFDLRLTQGSLDESPVLIVKFFRDKSIKALVENRALWEDAPTFCTDAEARQAQILAIIEAAEADVKKNGETSIYSNFVKVVNDQNFTGLLALNTALDLQELPAVIKALMGGMVDKDGNSNIAAFRAHHVGVSISDTGDGACVALESSSIFALVDYEDDGSANTSLQTRSPEHLALDLDVLDSIYPCGANGLTCYGFKVIYVRALFTNNALSSFDAEVDLTVNNLFAVGVNLGGGGGSAPGGDGDNIIKINGSYSEHDGAQTYSFVAKKTYEFAFADNTYLKKITFDKVQFSATTEEDGGSDSSRISSRFGIWGSMEFNKLDFLDMFSFEKLSFADLGIEMGYDLLVHPLPTPPETRNLTLSFAPGNLRFDFGETQQRADDDSLLALLPFKLKSFLYSEDGQSISDLDYFGISLDTLGDVDTSPEFNFALIFDLDLGSLGGLVGDLSAFKFSIILGWQPATGKSPNALVFGVQMPEADGKLELTIEGVLKIAIELFQLKYVDNTQDPGTKLLVLAMHNSYMEILGTRIPPGNVFFDLALFAPTKGDDKIGWIAALNAQDPKKKSEGLSMDGPMAALEDASRKEVSEAVEREMAEAPAHFLAKPEDDGDEGSSVLKLDYLGVGQRVGPDKKLKSFDEFLGYMRKDFWSAVKDGNYDKVYKPDGGWIVVANIVVLDLVGLGFVFYDDTPFYSLKIYITKGSIKGLSFEITYTKISDDVGLFFINFTLPDALRTFEVGAASLTLPALKLSIYTNSDFKIDLGFPANDNWSVCFRVEAFAGPIPVTGSGGFYIAKLSSATDDTFTAKDYSTILAAGFGVRLGVGKNFVAGPLKAGVSLTFFGIIEGAVGYREYDGGEGDTDIVEWLTQPKALALKGQFGVIGELYGSLDFVIIKASVNVRIQASVGIQLIVEDGLGGDLLLYVEASLSVSVSLKINLFLFSITISFSFKASFRFEWQIAKQHSAAHIEALQMKSILAAMAGDTPWSPDYPLQAGLNPALSGWMTPEFTTVWSDPAATGAPWFAVSLTMEYLPEPSAATIETLKPFETLAGQMLAWAMSGAANLPSWDAEITQKDVNSLNQSPEHLVGGLTYDVLLQGLGKMFTLNVTNPPAAPAGMAAEEKEDKYATIFPMPPFLTLATKGRDTELSYKFSSKSNVSKSWINTTLQDYFNELYTNITSPAGDAALAEVADDTVPLGQSMFLDWFQAVVRSALNAVLTQMQNDETESGKLSDIYLAAVKSGEMRKVAGQMAQFFRSGLRLPKTEGMEVPDGPLAETNPLYALIWQEFPVGATQDYTVSLLGDAAQAWLTVDADWQVTAADVAPYAISGSGLSVPSGASVMPVLQSGPQAFALANPITWTPAGGTARSLRPFPASMLTALKASAPLAISLSTRRTGKAFDPQTNPVPTTDTTFALSIEMVIRKVPAGEGQFLETTYALGAADLTQQTAMRELLAALVAGTATAKPVDLLFQSAADQPGLASDPAAKQLFVLRTNTTTQSVPPATIEALALTQEETVAVGANANDPKGFLQILEQASVTNQTGYFLTFETADGNGLPDALFGSQNFAPVTFLFELELAPAGQVYQVPQYANAVVLENTTPDLLYFAQTTEAADETSYVSTAAGALGFELSRAEPTGEAVMDHLANLYSLIAYQVPGSTGYRASGLSVPSGPQKESETDTTQSWRLFVPLYKLAVDNPPMTPEPNRYASIGQTASVDALIVDAFGNSFGGARALVSDHATLFFDDLVPLGNWSGIRSVFDFNAWSDPTDNTTCAAIDEGTGLATGAVAKPGMLSVYLCPSADALPTPGSDSALATAELYRTLFDQLSAKGPDGTATTQMFVRTNLDSTGSDIALDGPQTLAVLSMISDVESYLTGGTGADLPGVTLSIAVPGAADALPLVFEIAVDFGIKRVDFVAPEVMAAGYENAIRVLNAVPAQSDPEALQQLAADFAIAFPGYTLATGPADANGVVVPKPAPTALADEAKSSSAQPKGLWAVSTNVTDLQISKTRRAYLAPKPLDTKLRSGDVAMPNDLPGLGSLPARRTFSDVDLDQMARGAFSAIDNILGAENASNTFAQAPDAYRAIAEAREAIADRYSDNEVDWLLKDPAFQGQGSDLCQGQDLMAQQMRAALGSAYAINTIVQTDVSFAKALPQNMNNRLQLFGQMQRPSGQTGVETKGGGFGLGTARVDIPAGEGGQKTTTSFLYGVSDQKIEEDAFEQFALEWAVTHLQVFLDDRALDYCTHDEKAPPSVWLQFINAFTVAPQMGETIIPLAYREYPTPPTMIAQGTKVPDVTEPASLAELTSWIYTTTYQARLLSRDEITLNLIYNTRIKAGSSVTADFVGAPVSYTLFEALARFAAGYEVLRGQISPVPESGAADALQSFATLVTQLANNSDWVPANTALFEATGPVYTLEQDTVTDKLQEGGAREITLTSDPLVTGPNPWVGEKTVVALDPGTMEPYEGQTSTHGDRITTTQYDPGGMLSGNFVTHRVQVSRLTTLAFENANSGIGTRRNAQIYPDPTVLSNPEFIYQTPIVALTNPLTPFVVNNTIYPIWPKVVKERDQDLGVYIRRLLEELMGLDEISGTLSSVRMDDVSAMAENRRLKLDVRYGFPIGAPSGSSAQAMNLVPLMPVVLVRSFDLPVAGLKQAIEGWVGLSNDTGDLKPFAAVLADWFTAQDIALGQSGAPNAPPPGAFLSFDITLFSQLESGLNQLPLLRLTDLRLDLSVVKAPGA
ncbi:hypothetical protein ACN2XU_14740 [Primorskyibacter sp. 2E107]|uniref:hypothetical protein n=1 Tax=Primorskyibacter sp. 2E107 TaxID=3403458 RepID=UPI003AF5EDF1